MKPTPKRILSMTLVLLLLVSVLTAAPVFAADDETPLYQQSFAVVVPDARIQTAYGLYQNGTARGGSVLSLSLDPSAHPGSVFLYWKSAEGDVIPQADFELYVDRDAYIFPVYQGVSFSGGWSLLKAGDNCETGDIYTRSAEGGFVQYRRKLRNYGSHDLGDYEYIDETYCGQRCLNCNYIEKQEHDFDTDDAVILREATHENEGLAEAACRYCGHTMRFTVPPLTDHVWDTDTDSSRWEIVQPAADGAPGVRRRHCLYCDATEDYWYIEADWSGYLSGRALFYDSWDSLHLWACDNEHIYNFTNAEGYDTYVYGVCRDYRDNELCVAVMWIDHADELGRKPIYAARSSGSGGSIPGIGWSKVDFAADADEFLRKIDYLSFGDEKYSASAFDMFRRYETIYNDALLPAGGSSNLAEVSDVWLDNGTGTDSDTGVDYVALRYEDGRETLYFDPLTNTCIYDRQPNASGYTQKLRYSKPIVGADEAEEDDATVVRLDKLSRNLSYGLNSGNTGVHTYMSVNLLNTPAQPNYQLRIGPSYLIGGPDDNTASYPDADRMPYPRTGCSAYWNYYGSRYDRDGFALVRYPGTDAATTTVTGMTVELINTDGDYRFVRWEKYNPASGRWETFSDDPNARFNYVTETEDTRMDDIYYLRSVKEYDPQEVVTCHIAVDGGVFTDESDYSAPAVSEGSVAAGTTIRLSVPEEQLPVGKVIESWTVLGADSGEFDTVDRYGLYEVNRDGLTFVPVFTDATYPLDVTADCGMVYYAEDGEEYGGYDEFTYGSTVVLYTEGDEDYPYFIGWFTTEYTEEGEERELVSTEPEHTFTVNGYLPSYVAVWSSEPASDEPVLPDHTATGDGVFLFTYHANMTGLKVSALGINDYSNLCAAPDPRRGVSPETYTLSGQTTEDEPYELSSDAYEDGEIDFWIDDSLAGGLTVSLTGEEVTTPGDVNGDGIVDISDATAIGRHVAGLETLGARQLEAADINADGEVNVADVTSLQSTLAGITAGE